MHRKIITDFINDINHPEKIHGLVREYLSADVKINSPIIKGYDHSFAVKWLSNRLKGFYFEKPTTIKDIIVDKGKACMIWETQACHVGELYDIPSTNQIINFSGSSLFYFNNKLITEYHESLSINELVAKLRTSLLSECTKDINMAIVYLRDTLTKCLNIKLTTQEMKCLILWLFGHSLKRCSVYLNVSEKTVANHRANITFKMQGLPMQTISRCFYNNNLADIFALCEQVLSKGL